MGAPVKFKFRKKDNIGAADAIDDNTFLANCFVDKGDLNILRDFSDPRTIVVGRTGCGKSALLIKLRDVEKRTINIEPESLSLTYISNSTIINFLSKLGVNLDVFYKLLWRHVFAIEIMKFHFDIKTEQSLKSFRQRIRMLFMNKKDRNAIKYLEKWGDTFWEATEYRIKEITKQFEEAVKSNIKMKIPKISFGIHAAEKLTQEEKADVIQRAQYILNTVQVRQLSDIISLIDSVLVDKQKPCYITIDGLDQGWVEDKLRYKLIRALIETAREFGKVKHSKIIVAIRQDLLDRVFRLVRDPGYQEEKFRSVYLSLNWERKKLTEVLDSRIDFLIRRQYTKQKVTHKDILPKEVNKTRPIEFIVQRTMKQPRDIIHFFNKCIQQAKGQATIKERMIKQAEGEYSRDRLRYLADEWFSDYPNLVEFAMILKKRKKHFRIGNLNDKDCEDFCLNFCITNSTAQDYFSNLANHLVNANLSAEDFRKQIFPVFYKVGIVGLKIESYEKYSWTTTDSRNISSAEISDNTRVAIHPAFWRVLGIITK
ncbi:MAG: P-loop ATPase, Sll1717 family [Planctomycetota bacterium]|jgi:hypothetical protein